MHTREPDAIDAAVAAFRAADLTTWDGAVVTGEQGDCIFVGYDGDPEGDFQAVESNQEWAGIGARKRDEEFDIICAAWCQRGDSDIRAIREAVYALTAAAADALRDDPSLGQDPPFVAEYRPGELFIIPDEQTGLEARRTFRIHVKTRV